MLDIGKSFLTRSIVKHWKRLFREVVEYPCVQGAQCIWYFKRRGSLQVARGANESFI